MTYEEQLKSKEWKLKRLSILKCSFFKCELCGYSNPNNLQVHHKCYITGRMAWEYDRRDLIVLCRECHRTVHLPELNEKKEKKLHISEHIKNLING